MDTGYNEKGLVESKTYPYFEGDTAYEILYFYDPVDRLFFTYNPDNTYSSITYDKGWITYIDANSHKKVQRKDIYNRNVIVEEYTGNSSSTYALYSSTNYWYDVLNNLETVVDASDNHNQTNITYDSLSRKIAMDDPDMGNWEYDYDANGNLVYQKDAKLQEINFTYDALNRVTLKDYPTGTDVIYTYDETLYTNPKGRLTTLSDSSGTTKSNYDSMGQITSSIKTIASDSSTYTTQTQYDPLGRVKKIIYPDTPATEVNYTYDGNGNIKDIKSGTTTYAGYTSYTALGDPLSINYGKEDYGNAVVTSTYQYLPQNNRLYQLTTNSVTQGGLINISYNYDNVGNIRIISDYNNGSRTRIYTYDELDRLIEANSQMYGGSLLYAYDKIGNMTYNCRKGYYEYDSDHPHAVKRIKINGETVESYNYDANGNMYAGGNRALEYDYDNRPTSIIYNGNATVNVYDASGNRIQKMISAPSQNITKYIGQLYECNGGQCTKYIFAGMRRIAQIKGTETYYYHTDHLESSTVITDQNGNKVEEILYYPFGERLSDTGSINVKYKFNGHEFDAETELIYMGARYYDPKLARFISADTIVPLPFYPQSLNRFSYTMNNPIVLRELNGHMFACCPNSSTYTTPPSPPGGNPGGSITLNYNPPPVQYHLNVPSLDNGGFYGSPNTSISPSVAIGGGGKYQLGPSFDFSQYHEQSPLFGTIFQEGNNYPIGSEYFKIRTIDGVTKIHLGIDIPVPQGTTLKSPINGKTIFSGLDSKGNSRFIIQGTGNFSNYKVEFFHMSERISQGLNVNAGDVTGASGGTVGTIGAGTSTGPHVHMNVYYGSSLFNAWIKVDPTPYYKGAK